MKKLLILSILAATILSSCKQELPVTDPNSDLQDVVFIGANADNGGTLKSVQDCTLEADYAMVVINGDIYYPATFIVNDVLYTQAIKLPSDADYHLEEFILFNDNGTPGLSETDRADDLEISAAPHAGSNFSNFVLNPLNVEFEILPFTKIELVIEVLCLEESNFEDFGFVWFTPELTTIREIFFYGDFCTEMFLEYEGSLYGDYPKVDMPTIFKVEVKRDNNLDGIYEKDMGVYDNEEGYINEEGSASVPPLNIRYVDRSGIEDRYELRIYIYEFVGIDIGTGEPIFDYKYYTSWYFSDNADVIYTDLTFTESFSPGSDGIFDFIVGNCVVTDNDVEIPDPDVPHLEGEETAFAYGVDLATCFIDLGFHRWGWTNNLTVNVGSSYDWPIYAGAGQCDIEKGTLVGSLNMEFIDASTARITYEMIESSGYLIEEIHLFVGSDILPVKKGTYYTVAPGQYPVVDDSLGGILSKSYDVSISGGEVNIVAHAVVSGF